MLFDHPWFCHVLRPFLAPKTHHALGMACRLYWTMYTKKETTITVFASKKGGWRKQRPSLFSPQDVEAVFIRLPNLQKDIQVDEFEKQNALFRRLKAQIVEYWVAQHPNLCDIEIRWMPKKGRTKVHWIDLLQYKRYVRQLTACLMEHGFEPYKHRYPDRAIWVR